MSDENKKPRDDRQKVNEGYQPDQDNSDTLRKGYQPSMDSASSSTQSDQQPNETPPTGGSNVQPAKSSDKKED